MRIDIPKCEVKAIVKVLEEYDKLLWEDLIVGGRPSILNDIEEGFGNYLFLLRLIASQYKKELDKS